MGRGESGCLFSLHPIAPLLPRQLPSVEQQLPRSGRIRQAQLHVNPWTTTLFFASPSRRHTLVDPSHSENRAQDMLVQTSPGFSAANARRGSTRGQDGVQGVRAFYPAIHSQRRRWQIDCRAMYYLFL